jgi:hypothetical protein
LPFPRAVWCRRRFGLSTRRCDHLAAVRDLDIANELKSKLASEFPIHLGVELKVANGSIERGAQNLPGNWESSKFNLPTALYEMIPTIGEHEASLVLHNDAVVQGLSEIPFMQDVSRWGVLTIGTGLGNARFTNRQE